MVWLLSNNSSEGYLRFFEKQNGEIFSEQEYIIQYTLPRTPIYQESVFFPLSDIMDLRRQSSSMCIIMLGCVSSPIVNKRI